MIILIRHAEKKKDSIHLSHKGVLRANYLADYFKFPYGEFNVPSRVVAMSQHHHGSSDRCFETVAPVCKSLSIQHVKSNISKNHVKQVVDYVNQMKFSKETILICWEHTMIPIIAHLLGYPVTSWGMNPLSANEKAGKHCYDATWVIDLKKRNSFCLSTI